MAKLLVNESAGSREFELVDAEAHIGRELDNSVRIADPSISRHHAVVRRTPTGYEVQDLQSSNGVLLNGSRVQTAPLQDGDRITLGQIQLTFLDPQPADINATVAVSRTEAPAPPLGTMRMSADQMAQIHGAPPPAPTPPSQPFPVPAPMPPQETADVPRPRPLPPPPAAFGHATNPGTHGGSMAQNPAPAFLQPYLPPVPDDAQPTGERGDFVTRLLAILIDCVPAVGLAIVFMFIHFALAFIPILGCIAGCGLSLVEFAIFLGYGFYFIPWCTSKFGATIGKKMMKLRVVPENDPSGRLAFGTAILRQLGHLPFINLVNLMILGEERKGLTDMIAKSLVIKVDR